MCLHHFGYLTFSCNILPLNYLLVAYLKTQTTSFLSFFVNSENPIVGMTGHSRTTKWEPILAPRACFQKKHVFKSWLSTVRIANTSYRPLSLWFCHCKLILAPFNWSFCPLYCQLVHPIYFMMWFMLFTTYSLAFLPPLCPSQRDFTISLRLFDTNLTYL